jgi:hypothetical protein
MTSGTGTPEDPIVIEDWTLYYGWGIWRTAAHYGGPFDGPPSTPMATGSVEGVLNFARTIPRTKRDPRPLLAHRQPDGTWRAKHFVDTDGNIATISPNATDDDREKQRDRYDECHAGTRRWYKPEFGGHDYYPHTIEVGDKGYPEQP